MIDDIRRALHEEIRWLMSLVQPNPMYHGEGASLYVRTKGKEGPPPAVPVYGSSAKVRRALRIEIDRDTFPRLMFGAPFDVGQTLYNRQIGQQEGPMLLEGVPLYEVGWLPEPGWRVINAIRVLRG